MEIGTVKRVGNALVAVSCVLLVAALVMVVLSGSRRATCRDACAPNQVVACPGVFDKQRVVCVDSTYEVPYPP